MKSTIITILAAASIATAAQAAPNSPYISRVYDFVPAPGQFVNDIPAIPADATPDSVCSLVLEQIGREANPGMISLGAFGGYVIFGFDHPLVNVEGEYDFKIAGNAFVSDRDSGGGSCEPGIVMVAVDANGNGLPDDPWYELAGSAYAQARKGFSIKYTKPATLEENYPFTTNDPDMPRGQVERNIYHTQSYWPEWIGRDTLEFEGTLLPDNGVNQGDDENPYWVLKFYDWGYVDNLPNADDPGLKLDWAVDADGKPVKLNKVDFIKVYTAESQTCGWLGETSTEICGATDLHPDAVAFNAVESVSADSDVLMLMRRIQGSITVRSGRELPYSIYAADGRPAGTGILATGDNVIATDRLSHGIYILRTAAGSLKFAL